MLVQTELDNKIKKMVQKHQSHGWVLEPDAKQLMHWHGLDIPKFVLTRDVDSAQTFLKRTGGPVVAKAVSKKILHKTEFDAVITNILSPDKLKQSMDHLLSLEGCETILVEEMVKGIEVIIGAKKDFQFGPVIVFGVGGTSVEIYNDTAIRMAPLESKDISSMVHSLKGRQLITGYRGGGGVNMENLTQLLVTFSKLIMRIEDQIESVDLNPVICTKDQCIIADARIMLQ